MAFWKNNKSEGNPLVESGVISVSTDPMVPSHAGVIQSSSDTVLNHDLKTDLSSNQLQSPEKVIEDRYGSKIRAALGAGTVIQGKLSFDTAVRIDGKLKGEIFSSKALIVGPTGNVDAQVETASLIILGDVKGNIKVTEKIEIFAGGKLEGTISTPSLVIHDGAKFNGACSMKAHSVSTEVSKAKGAKSNVAGKDSSVSASVEATL